jgi:hypothetical protein
MHTLTKVALVGLSVIGVLAGVVPAAKAADSSIYWAQDAGELLPGRALRVCSSGAGFETGQTVLVEVREGGTWVGKGSFPRAAADWCVDVDPTTLTPGPGTYVFRASSRVPSTGELVSTGEAAFTLKQEDVAITWLDAGGDFEPSSDWMGNGLRLSTGSPSGRTTRLSLSAAHGQEVVLQRKSGSTWVTVNRVTAPTTGRNVKVTLSFPARAGLSTHRFVSGATAWSPTVATDSFIVFQSAKINRSAYQSEARAYMAQYCPKTPISLDTPAVRSGPAVGRASASYKTSGPRGSRFLSTRIEVRTGMPPNQLRSVALHECGHVVQYRAHVQGRFAEVDRQAAKLWPGLGREGQADCMSYSVTRDVNWLGYVRSCSSTQLVNAAKMWKTYGGKYQAATYRW